MNASDEQLREIPILRKAKEAADLESANADIPYRAVGYKKGPEQERWDEANRKAIQAWANLNRAIQNIDREELAAELLREREARRAAEAERDRLRKLPDWIITKLKTLGAYYEPPTDSRDAVAEIQGWMHVLCFHYVQNRREVKEYDTARRRAKELVTVLAAARNRVRGLEDAGRRVVEACDNNYIEAMREGWNAIHSLRSALAGTPAPGEGAQ